LARLTILDPHPLIDTLSKTEIIPSIGVFKQGLPLEISTVLLGSTVIPQRGKSATPFNFYLFLLVLLNAISFSPYATGSSANLVSTFFANVPVREETRKMLLDAYVASLCWGTCYVFVRRIWNPENAPMSQALNKFAADGIFGGLAAGAGVIMRQALLSVLR